MRAHARSRPRVSSVGCGVERRAAAAVRDDIAARTRRVARAAARSRSRRAVDVCSGLHPRMAMRVAHDINVGGRNRARPRGRPRRRASARASPAAMFARRTQLDDARRRPEARVTDSRDRPARRIGAAPRGRRCRSMAAPTRRPAATRAAASASRSSGTRGDERLPDAGSRPPRRDRDRCRAHRRPLRVRGPPTPRRPTVALTAFISSASASTSPSKPSVSRSSPRTMRAAQRRRRVVECGHADMRGHDRLHAGCDRGTERLEARFDVARDGRKLEMRVLLGRAVTGKVLCARGDVK